MNSAGISLSRTWLDAEAFRQRGEKIPTYGPVTRKEAERVVTEMFDVHAPMAMRYPGWTAQMDEDRPGGPRRWKAFVRDVIVRAQEHGLKIVEEKNAPRVDALDEVMILRAAVREARAAQQRREISLDELYAVADAYIEAVTAKAKRLWPNRKFYRPSRAYILRAL